jgi:hypothetical protein
MTLSAQLECFYSSYIVPGIKQMEETAKKRLGKKLTCQQDESFQEKRSDLLFSLQTQ